MMKYFVVLEIGWEYNDEYMYRPESRGGVPTKIFTDEKEAEEACVEMNFEAVKKKFSRKYSYGLADYCGEDGPVCEFGEAAMQVFVDAGKCTIEELNDSYGWEVDLSMKDMSDDQIREFLSKLESPLFYEVVEVEQ